LFFGNLSARRPTPEKDLTPLFDVIQIEEDSKVTKYSKWLLESCS